MSAAPAMVATSPGVDGVDLEEAARDRAEVLDDLGLFGALVEVKNQHYRPRSGTPAKVSLGWENWNPEQRAFERDRTGYDLICKSRQVGVSTIEKLRDLQYALTNEAAQVLVVTHTTKELRKFFNSFRSWSQRLADLGIAPPPSANTVDYLYWEESGSSIHIVEAGATAATATDRGRSGTIDRLHATEVAFWRAAETTWTSLIGGTEHGSEIVIESTANGLGGFFHKRVLELQQGRFKPFRFHFYPWFMHPGRTADPRVYSEEPKTRRARMWEERMRKLGVTPGQIAWWRQKVMSKGGDLDAVLQEYPPTPEAAFQSGGDSWIEPEHIDRVQADGREPVRFHELRHGGEVFAPLRVHAEPVEGAHYIVTVDPAEGGGGESNEAAIKVIDHRTGEDVASWDSNEVKPKMLGRLAVQVARLYNSALLAVERNVWRTKDRDNSSGGGLATLKAILEDERYPVTRVFHTEDGKPGWSTNSKTRTVMFDELVDGIEDGSLTTPDKKTAKEMASVELVNGRPMVPRKGRDGADDGLWACWAIAIQVRALTRIPGRTIADVGGELETADFQP